MLNQFKNSITKRPSHTDLDDYEPTQTLDSQKIKNFKEHNYFKKIDTDSLKISRAEWLSLIYRFEQEKRVFVTQGFFLHSLSDIRKISVDQLLLDESLIRLQPARQVKQVPLQKPTPPKRTYDHFKQGQMENPLIFEVDNTNVALQDKIQATGARCTTLEEASPVRDRVYKKVKRTPGGTKTRPVFSAGVYNFFQPISPNTKIAGTGRADVNGVQKETVLKDLPKITYQQAEIIEFTATRTSIEERANQPRRRSQIDIKKASCSDVFRAHGIEISPSQNNRHHWSHLIAFFLGGLQGFDNLVPSTAAANYNTLEAIELYIKELLVKNTTDEVQIKVEPSYAGEELIPDILTYSLNWIDNSKPTSFQKCSETFYISPKSYQRFSKRMLETLNSIRTTVEEDALANDSLSTSNFI